MALVNALLQRVDRVREIVCASKTAEDSKVQALRGQAADLFEDVFEEYSVLVTTQNDFSASFENLSPLVVSVAEAAFEVGKVATSRLVIEKYLSCSPQKDQFFCRANLTLALVIDSESAMLHGQDIINMSKFALQHVFAAIDVASQPQNLVRYRFVVLNASLVAWSILHKFIRPERARFFSDELNRICTALEAIEDSNKLWRITILSATSFSYLDDNQSKPSCDLLDKAIGLIEGIMTDILTTESQINAELGKQKVKTEEVLNAIRKVEENELLKTRKQKIDPDSDEPIQLAEVPELTGLAATGIDALRVMLNKSQTLKSGFEETLKQELAKKYSIQEQLIRLYMQRIQANSADSKRVFSLQFAQGIRAKSLLTLQSVLSGAIAEKDAESSIVAVVNEIKASPLNAQSVESLLDICKVCWQLKLVTSAKAAFEVAETFSNISYSLRVKMDLCKALEIFNTISQENPNEKYAQRLNRKQLDGFVVSRRIEAIKLLERCLTMSISKPDLHYLVLELSVVAWNILYPLCQSHLRNQVHKILQLMSSSLEKIASPFFLLRTQVYFELSKCEEKEDFIVKATLEGKKALSMDYGSLDSSLKVNDELDRKRHFDHIIRPYVELLENRSNLYNSPSDVETKVSLLIQQVRESSSRKTQIEILRKASDRLFSELYGIPDSNALSVLSTAEIETILSTNRSPPPSELSRFTLLDQKRFLILISLAELAQQLKLPSILHHAVKLVLSYIWNSSDPFLKSYIFSQIDVHFLLVESLMEQLATMPCPEPESPEVDSRFDPRAAGLTSGTVPKDVLDVKRVIIRAIESGIKLAQSIGDLRGVQNGIIVFWNLHVHIFRKELFADVIPEFNGFIKFVVDLFESYGSKSDFDIEEGIKMSIVECMALINVSAGQLQPAHTLCMKYLTMGSIYNRRKLSQIVGQCIYGANSKANSKQMDLPKMENPLLSVYGYLALVEQLPLGTLKETGGVYFEKMNQLLGAEFKAFSGEVDFSKMSQDEFDQLMEMQTECWTRITRLKILCDDIRGAQETANKCMQLVAKGLILEIEEKKMSPKVWRWVSVCERFFGMAISRLIKDDGQDSSLKNELRLACLRHFAISCEYAKRSNREDLLISSGIEAWNISFHLIDNKSTRKSFRSLIRRILDLLSGCSPSSPILPQLRLNLFLALVEGHSQEADWDSALTVLNHAFEQVPAPLQKSLWKWKVISMSKKGKNVLDGIQKLKENNPALQAGVFAILARSSSVEKVQFESYTKAIDILQSDITRVDYLLETAQWMASVGVPVLDIANLVQSAIDSLQEFERIHKEDEDAAGDENTSVVSDLRSYKSGVSRNTSRSNISKTSKSREKVSRRASSAGSTKSRLPATEDDADSGFKFNFQYFEWAFRSYAMMAMLCLDPVHKVKYCLSGVAFLNNSLQYLSSFLCEEKLKAMYYALPQSERDVRSFEDFKASTPAPDFTLPGDVSARVSWSPKPEFSGFLKECQKSMAHFVPSTESLPNFPLTIHYCFWVARFLCSQGFAINALSILLWLRFVINQIPVASSEVLRPLVHFKILSILINLGLMDKAAELNPATASFSDDLSRVLSQREHSVDMGDPVTPQNEKPNVFGFYTVTQLYKGVDRNFLFLELAEDLLELNRVDFARNVCNYLLLNFRAASNFYGVAQVVAITSKINLIAGSYDVVVSDILNSFDAFTRAGDPTLYSRLVGLLIRSYIRLKLVDDAKEIAGSSLQYFHSIVNSGRGVTFSELEAYFEFYKTYSQEILISDAIDKLGSNLDCRSILVELKDQFSTFVDLVSAKIGTQNNILSDSMCFFSDRLFDLLVSFHLKCSKFAAIESYSNWISSELQYCIRTIEKAINIRRGLLSYLPPEELRQLAASGEVVLLQTSPQRYLVFAELSLLKMSLFYSQMKPKYVRVQHSSKSLTELNVIERFVLETEQAVDFCRDDFVCTSSVNSHLLAISAMQHLLGSGFEDCDSFLVALSAAHEAVDSGLFRELWEPNHASSEPFAGEIQNSVREELASKVSPLLHIRAAPMADIFAAASCMLFDMYGPSRPDRAAHWLMQLQSIQARKWLEENWMNSLDITSDVSVILNKQKMFTGKLKADGFFKSVFSHELQQLRASTQWKRLDVSADATAVLEQILTPTHFAMSIQSNIDFSQLFLCIGAQNKADKKKFNWVVDKMEVSESTKRRLLGLAQQLKQWKDDVLKFIAAFNELLPNDSIFELDENAKPKYIDKTMIKSERALEERFRALLDDLESIVAPLIGPQSQAAGLLRNLSSLLSPKANTEPQMLSLSFFVDTKLQMFPWEALSFFGAFKGKVVRDFSLHLLGHRLGSLLPNSSSSSSSGMAPVAVSIPATTAAGGATAGGGSGTSVQIHAQNFRILVDPFHDDEGFHQHGIDRPSISDVCGTFLGEHHESLIGGGRKWAKIAESRGTLSYQDWIHSLQPNSKPLGVLAYTTGRLGSLLSPIDIAMLNLDNVALFVLCDLTHNDASYRRLSGQDNCKLAHEIVAEQPFEIFGLLSLAGVGAISGVHWCTSFASHKKFSEDFFVGLTKKSTNFVNALSCGLNADKASVKRWIKFARVSFGVPTITYSDV